MARGSLHVLLGTRKGAYVLDGASDRKKWTVRGPYHAGGDVFRVVGDPRAPGTVYALVNNPFWGPTLQKSTDWGKRWKEVSLPNMVRSKERPNPMEAETMPPKYAVVNSWQMIPGKGDDPKSLLLGIDPASLWRSFDGGESWQAVPGLNDHPTRPKWNPGAGGMCLHTILRDPSAPNRLYVGISAAGTFRSEDDGAHWSPMNQGVRVSFMPEKYPEVGQCVHKVAMDPSNPSVLYRQDHDGIYVSRNRGDRWIRVGKPLAHDFGFVAATADAAPGGAYFVPLDPEGRTTWDHQFQMFRWEEETKRFRALLPKGAFPGDHGSHRDALATDTMDPPGVYFGTTGGRLLYTPNGGKAWREVPFAFPSIHSVAVAGPS